MPCFHPTRVLTDGQKIAWAHDWRNHEDFPRHGEFRQNIPCRECLGCRQADARQWAVRCYHEAQLHQKQWRDPSRGVVATIPNASVLTLTYKDEHLPKGGWLRHADFQHFMTQLRNHRRLAGQGPVRFFMCGEYGEKYKRCHMHSIIYGETFDDRYETVDTSGKVHQHSYLVDDLWGRGRATVDDFTFEGASYVAGYVAKKLVLPHQTGPVIETKDAHTNETRFIHPAPEYRQMSRRPGLGCDWIMKPENMSKVYEGDFCQIGEFKYSTPGYYDRLHAREDKDAHKLTQEARLTGIEASALSWDSKRCAAAETIAYADLRARMETLTIPKP